MNDEEKTPNNIFPSYVFDVKRGFPFVWLPDLTEHEEAELVKDALKESKNIDWGV